MDLGKIGVFIGELRSERNLTQEQLAEEFGVSRRTVSRWETGRNLPDISLLAEMSDYFDVDLREILDGERKDKKMNEEMRDTVNKVAEFSDKYQEMMNRRAHFIFILGFLAGVAAIVIKSLGHMDSPVAAFCEGAASGILLFGIIITSNLGKRLREWKRKRFYSN